MLRIALALGNSLLVLCSFASSARAQDCASIRDVGRQGFAQFAIDFPASLAWVANPVLVANPLRLDVKSSLNFHPLLHGSCKILRRADLANVIRYGYFWFVLNNAVVVTDDTDLEGRSFVAIQVDVRYRNSSPTIITVYRNTARKGQPLIWHRMDRPIAGLPSTVANIDIPKWNELHQQNSIQAVDGALLPGSSNKAFHATPVEGTLSTWELKTKLILDDAPGARQIASLLIAFRLTDSQAGGGSGIPFQVRPTDIANLSEIRIRIVTELPDLNAETKIVIRDN